jgi:hypothetical protein
LYLLSKYRTQLEKSETPVKDTYNFSRIADVEMALYVYAFLGEAKVENWATQRYIDIRNHHEETASLIKKIRTRNLISEIWNLNKLHMAELLLETDVQTAGIFAGFTLENCLRKFADHCNIDTKNEYGTRRLIDDLVRYKKIGVREASDLQKAWKIRCNCVHGEKESFGNVKNIIKITKDFYDTLPCSCR